MFKQNKRTRTYIHNFKGDSYPTRYEIRYTYSNYK